MSFSIDLPHLGFCGPGQGNPYTLPPLLDFCMDDILKAVCEQSGASAERLVGRLLF